MVFTEHLLCVRCYSRSWGHSSDQDSDPFPLRKAHVLVEERETKINRHINNCIITNCDTCHEEK